MRIRQKTDPAWNRNNIEEGIHIKMKRQDFFYELYRILTKSSRSLPSALTTRKFISLFPGVVPGCIMQNNYGNPGYTDDRSVGQRDADGSLFGRRNKTAEDAEYAGFWVRMAAYCIDLVIVGITWE